MGELPQGLPFFMLPDVPLVMLPQATRVIFQLYSKNRHPAGWTGCPIFGFSHSVDVCVAIARAGGFPVLGLARELPHEIPHILAEASERGAAPLEAAVLQAGAKRISSLQSGVVITPRPRPPPGLKRNRTKRAKPDVTQLDE